MGFFKKIGLVCLSIGVLYPVALLFGIVKPALLIAVTGLIIKFLSGDEVLIYPLRFAVAVAFSVTTVSYISIVCPITTIPVVALAPALCGILVLIDYQTKGKSEWYTRAVIVPIILACIIWPKVWAVNELFYGTLLQALRLPDWTGRGMELINGVLIRHCGLAKKDGM
ncbi:MAG: hypothetical protein K6U80_17625 [Firmicutes bacterium]|nr:hypothetical protein [Bacillota bacterium]